MLKNKSKMDFQWQKTEKEISLKSLHILVKRQVKIKWENTYQILQNSATKNSLIYFIYNRHMVIERSYEV